jgi:crotonobetainyl-CoA:carnitine CoA-transferase CaiB-like acyl-CoA transferase
LSWHGRAAIHPDRPGSEAAIQALCGLMQVHGRDEGRPRRIGLEVASVAAGVLGACGILAGLVARSRGRAIARVETSVLEACLLLVSHYVAVATCSGDHPGVAGGPAPGPPFQTADDHWFEIEVLDPEPWKHFWTSLGTPDVDLGRAWTSFRLRYNRGACSLPEGLHEATARHNLVDIAAMAAGCGVSLCPLRSYREVVEDPGPWEGRPIIEDLPARRDLATVAAPLPPDGPFGPGRSETGPLPLEGVRVVEATNRVQGPLAGLLLQMLGADVVLVEPPGGDVARMGMPAAGDTGAFFMTFNRGKRSTELDLASASGRTTLVELVAGADVFLHNWRPGKAEEWGLDAELLASHNPRLVHAQASGWGPAKDVAHLTGTDFMVQAYAGVGDGVNPEGEPPFPSRALLTDYMGGLVACEGILAGLYRREQSGWGCRVNTSLLAAAMTLQSPVLEALAAGREEGGRRTGRPVWGAVDRPLQASDGFVVLSADDEPSFERLCAALDVDAAGTSRADAERQVVKRMRSSPAAQAEELLVGAGIPCAVSCTDPADLPADPRLSALFESLGGTAQVPASPWHFT